MSKTYKIFWFICYVFVRFHDVAIYYGEVKTVGRTIVDAMHYRLLTRLHNKISIIVCLNRVKFTCSLHFCLSSEIMFTTIHTWSKLASYYPKIFRKIEIFKKNLFVTYNPKSYW